MSVALRTSLLVIGAGPAGLAAAAVAQARGCDYLVLETGSRVERRDHTEHRTLGTGVGGAGLYSDGKFSFHPSATALWRLRNRGAVVEAYRWFAEVVADFGLVAPALSDVALAPAPVVETGRKDYPSAYLGYGERKALIETLQGTCGANLLCDTSMSRVSYDPRTRRFLCVADTFRIEADALVYAAGRFGPRADLGVAQVFRRVEVGVRLEQDSGTFFLREDPRLDPKLLFASRDGRYGWRTFCCCREGEIVTTEIDGIVSVSGRSDCPPTGRSNVGFNLRVKDVDLARKLWPDGPVALCRGTKDQELRAYLADPTSGPIAEVLGNSVSLLVAEGLSHLCCAYPSLSETPCRVVAPAVEGVGSYPVVCDDLQVLDIPCRVAGDATGLFRGLTAALVSGHYAGTRAVATLPRVTG